MTFELNFAQRALLGDLNPRLTASEPDKVLARKLNTDDKVKYELALFSLLLPEPFDRRSLLYRDFIDNEKNKFLNQVTPRIEAESEMMKEQYVNRLLMIDLKRYFEAIEAEKNLRQDNPADQPVEELEAYIIEILTLSLIHIYQEVHECFREYVKQPFNSLQEFYLSILNCPAPTVLPVNRKHPAATCAPKVVEPKPTEKEDDTVEKQPEFEVQKGDFREGYNGKLSYDDIEKPLQFQRFEQHLFEGELIDKDYNFIPNRTKAHNKFLATLMRVIIDKGYFKSKNHKFRKGFQPHHYRAYLEHRYNTKLSQDFSRARAEDIGNFKYPGHWIFKL